ncbi:hypothetical protein D3C87_1379550 [compost metagenome]
MRRVAGEDEGIADIRAQGDGNARRRRSLQIVRGLGQVAEGRRFVLGRGGEKGRSRQAFDRREFHAGQGVGVRLTLTPRPGEDAVIKGEGRHQGHLLFGHAPHQIVRQAIGRPMHDAVDPGVERDAHMLRSADMGEDPQRPGMGGGDKLADLGVAQARFGIPGGRAVLDDDLDGVHARRLLGVHQPIDVGVGGQHGDAQGFQHGGGSVPRQVEDGRDRVAARRGDEGASPVEVGALTRRCSTMLPQR